MGLHLGPRCPECDKNLHISIIGRGYILADMLFCMAHCTGCGVQYHAWCDPLGKWSFDTSIPQRIAEFKEGKAAIMCEPRDVLLGYNPSE